METRHVIGADIATDTDSILPGSVSIIISRRIHISLLLLLLVAALFFIN